MSFKDRKLLHNNWDKREEQLSLELDMGMMKGLSVMYERD